MAISEKDLCYAWYKDGTVSYGKSNDLDFYKRNYTFQIPLRLELDNIMQLFQNELSDRIAIKSNGKSILIFILVFIFFDLVGPNNYGQQPCHVV